MRARKLVGKNTPKTLGTITSCLKTQNKLSLLMIDTLNVVSITLCLALIGESNRILIYLLLGYLSFPILPKTIAIFSNALLKYREILLF
jgi:hypothetical protein